MRAPVTSISQRTRWWSAAAAREGLALTRDDLRLLAATTGVDPEQIRRCVAATVGLPVPDRGTAVSLLQEAARDVVPVSLPPGVRRVVPVHGWDDLVIAEPKRQLLRSIHTHVLHGGRVLEDWGFAARMPYGQGVVALFSGPSGTGKTMAAQIIAADLGLDVLQVDLSKTVSKYIGETEKNLDEIFSAAELAGSMVLFDEADAVFGKRTEIKDAHDRHANVEVAYLLQRLEAFRGIAVLTTNLRQNIDDAFVRRLRFVVDFALPTVEERARIWRRAFPADAPLADGLDLLPLARILPLAGGSIQNIALDAGFLAAGEDSPIARRHVLIAARRELVKIGMLTAEKNLDDLEAS
jgi:SpoVK/Ycf46/Vps4 family AAA+-type ATPase